MLAKKLWLGCVFVVTAFGVNAEQQSAQTIKVGTGGKSGNYYSMMNDIKDYCSDALTPGSSLQVEESDGSVDNVMGLTDKRFSAGIVQEDVLQYFKKTQPRSVNTNRIKIISGLHMESVHLLVPKGYEGDKQGGIKGMFGSLFGDDDKKPVSIDMLKGQTIGSWGGSVVSAKALSYFMNLNLNVVEVPTKDRRAPNIPLLLVGGHPYKPVQDLLETGKYVLIPIDYAELRDKAPFYLKSTISYKNNGKIKTVPTFGVRALFVGKSFRRESRNENMTKLAQCVQDSLIDLADDPDTNPAWGSVYELEDDGEQTSWSYFPLK
ncbi:hypothetical protein OAP63_17020 [Vibrio sp.]|uniref:TAXI family TRAP transporter solute-binding subunit n=1 Tax=Vibrio viridaestus TaxID=2487322 RepID=A0A3N9TLZ1_9VIBR|nr:TAXI family TRAP transporter solute-binding subunit [Vibrio viridaestus]MDC0612434.1 hypothetical protein [Vibrio sp.]RQW65014.1 hypothetical protein EES38_02995 [Vibrio viridaestus]